MTAPGRNEHFQKLCDKREIFRAIPRTRKRVSINGPKNKKVAAKMKLEVGNKGQNWEALTGYVSDLRPTKALELFFFVLPIC